MGDSRMSANGGSFDVIIIGAGISGINMAYRLQTQIPGCTYTILEARQSLGGTWDLFRYPGIRSDSDLFTFGFPWYPWRQENPIASGESIMAYMKDAAAKFGIDQHIRYKHSLDQAAWSSKHHAWSLTVNVDGEAAYYTARFLVFGTGYYNYHTPLETDIPGIGRFQGETVHPQFWPEHLDYADKQIVIIGSGATAVTLLPQLAKKAKLTTMLQRSPSYILPMPNRDQSRSKLSYLLPTSVYYKLKRLSWIIFSRLFVGYCRRFPNRAKQLIEKSVTPLLPLTISYEPHFKPRYLPWEQRLCVCPDGDFYSALRSGKAVVETGVIHEVVSDGIQLTSGKKLPADIIVTATGLKLCVGGGVQFEVDGEQVALNTKFLWNGVMLQDIPNAAFVIGYTDASWTLGADATAHFVCRLLQSMSRKGYVEAKPYLPNSDSLTASPAFNLNSTYVAVGAKSLPKTAAVAPWTGRGGYFSDMFWAKYGNITRGMRYVNGKAKNQ
ncbi:hypothetical protein AYO21_11335 [Fonsecaea monophora]|uniref:FAD/NAD(P)-binding domain-containing protein n=1 Tax=Fonsecaea monophora TaxID=254056 RepID=A0A177ER84_9EURO|nr:hypothetical protein AYO21_11335 [Fonsecaea monophora]OAG34513.1 hypothetical protein AYO21_11335 [Fonsecaea monophora]